MSGQLNYRILTDISEEYTLNSNLPGIVEPQVPHKVDPLGVVEFYREATS